MNDPEYDIHPLDRDYSEPVPVRGRKELTSDEQLRRIGVVVFLVGFALVLFAAIMLGIFRGAGWIESFGSSMHRFAMIAILLGGIMIIVSYRLSAIRTRTQMGVAKVRRKRRRDALGLFGMLFIYNVLFLVLMVAIAGLSGFARASPGLFLVYNAVFNVATALMVTMIVWHRGLLRAFAIGALVGLIMNGFAFLFAMNASYGYNNPNSMFLARVLVIQICGLVSAGYVALVQPDRSGESESKGRLDPSSGSSQPEPPR